MTQYEINALYNELYVRGLIKPLHDRMKKLRTFIIRRTILDAFKLEDYDAGNPLQKRILDEAQAILSKAQMEAA